MGALKIILTILFVLVSIVLTVIVLMQEGKSAGLGVISGAADTYWGKNKGRSLEGKLEKLTKILAVVFLVLATVLNINFNREASAGTDTTVTATEAADETQDQTDVEATEEVPAETENTAQ